MCMTVQELIDELLAVCDKTSKVSLVTAYETKDLLSVDMDCCEVYLRCD